MNYLLGKVVSVENGEIIVSLINHYINEEGKDVGVPESMKVDLMTEAGPIPLLIGQPGTFLEIQLTNGTMLGTITGIKMQELVPLLSEARYASEQSGIPVVETRRLLTITPIGKFHSNGEFERGSDILPTVNANAYAISPQKISDVYQSFTEGDFSIGELSMLPEQRAFINLDSFLGRHTAILGQTGGGKSWTVASLLQKISAFPKSTMLLLDLHGEYKEAFGDEVEYLSANDIELPYWLMNFEELMDLSIDRGEHSAPNQIAKFRELLQYEKERVADEEGLDLPKITLDTPIYFSFQNIINELERLDTEMVPGAKEGKTKKGDYFGDFSRMIMRLQSKLNDRRYDLIFKPTQYTNSVSMGTLFKKILGEGDSNKKLVVLDISPIPFDVRNSVISLILRLSFDFAYWHKRSQNRAYPIFIACDEAHIYLNSRENSSSSARLSAERIAKEGRKYGVGLMVISQRPRELSSTILSQCNTFVCLRLTNPDDQSYVKNLLPDSIKGIIDMVASLRRGEAIILGESVMMPTRVKIDIPNPQPNSNDVSFTGIWSDAKLSTEVEAVIDEWRRQGVKR